MNSLNKNTKPVIFLEEIDLKKKHEEILQPQQNKYKFLKDLRKDISFISVFSIALFAILGNISVYMWNKHPPSITYIPKQVNMSETDLITNTAYKDATNLLNFNYNNINNTSNADYFYKDSFEQWKNILKQLGIYDKTIKNQGEVNTNIKNVNLVSKTIVHGMVRNTVSLDFVQTYYDKDETTVTHGTLFLTMIENPDKNNQFLIYNSQLSLNDTKVFLNDSFHL